jgi:hypothetical protein
VTSRLGTGKPLTFFYSLQWNGYSKTIATGNPREGTKSYGCNRAGTKRKRSRVSAFLCLFTLDMFVRRKTKQTDKTSHQIHTHTTYENEREVFSSRRITVKYEHSIFSYFLCVAGEPYGLSPAQHYPLSADNPLQDTPLLPHTQVPPLPPPPRPPTPI